MRSNGPDVVILSNDFLRNGAEIVLSGDAVTAGGPFLCQPLTPPTLQLLPAPASHGHAFSIRGSAA